MEPRMILLPMVGMFVLVCAVAATMLRRRIAYFKANRLHPQKVATSAQMSALVPDSRAADNLRNLFELPVLFYVAILTIFSAGLICTAHVALAWFYVLARAAHSYIQCGSNVVMHRFYAFVASCTALCVIWLMLAYQLIFVLKG